MFKKDKPRAKKNQIVDATENTDINDVQSNGNSVTLSE